MTLLIDLLQSEPSEAWINDLRVLFRDSNPNRRMFAAMLLGRPSLGGAERLRMLRELLDDSNLEVQLAAIEAVRTLGTISNDVIEVLAKKLVSHPVAGVLTATVRTLRYLGTRSGPAMEFLSKIIENDRTPDAVRVGATLVLAGIGLPALRPLCRALVADPCVEVRQIAAMTFVNLASGIDFGSKDATTIEEVLAAAARREKDPIALDFLSKASVQIKDGGREIRKGLAQKESPTYPEEDEELELEGGWKLGKSSARTVQIKALIDAAAPVGFAPAAANANKLLLLTKQEIAERLTPLLSEHLKRAPRETYIQKQAIASWVNAELRELGLAICCPKTGKPAILIADIRGAGDDSSRFRLEIVDDEGRRVRTWTGSDLPDEGLELMADDARKEGPTVRRSRR